MKKPEPVSINSWAAFEEWVGKHKMFEDPEVSQKTEWIFRGMRSESYLVESSLQRLTKSIGRESDIRFIEQQLIRDFRRRITNFDGHAARGDLPESDLLAMMQHYGAPTRLIDWSYSPYWALFMALDRKWNDRPSEKDRAVVWVMQASSETKPNCIWERAQKDILAYVDSGGAGDRAVWKQAVHEFHTAGNADLLVRMLIENPFPCAFQFNSRWLNDRLSVQQGVFLCLGDPSRDLEANLPGDYDSGTYKLIIDRQIEHEMLRRLYRMSIHNGTAYPGLVGFAESLHMKSLIYRKMPEHDGIGRV